MTKTSTRAHKSGVGFTVKRERAPVPATAPVYVPPPPTKRRCTTSGSGHLSSNTYAAKIFHSLKNKIGEDARISGQTVQTLGDMMDSLIDTLSLTCYGLISKDNRKILKALTVQSAIRLCYASVGTHYVPGAKNESVSDSELYTELAKRATTIHAKAVKFTARRTKMKDAGKDVAGLYANFTRNDIGIFMAAQRLRTKYLAATGQQNSNDVSVSQVAQIMLIGVVEHIIGVVIEEAWTKRHKGVLTLKPVHVNKAVRENPELAAIFGASLIVHGGVMKTAHAVRV